MQIIQRQCIYKLTRDFHDYDENDNRVILYKKGEYVFICDCGNDEYGWYALIASKDLTIQWGPAGTRNLFPLLEEVDFDITNEEEIAKLLLILDGNMSIYDNKIRRNKR